MAVRVCRVALFVVIAFLVIRTLIVEPFGVPTGSMAGTMLGNHRETPCPHCGYPVVVGEMATNERRNPYAHGCCPNCGQRDIDLRKQVDLVGDRLLVDKVVYAIRKPRRWDVAVFRCPVDDSTPYVKRVVGLPNESIQVLGGDLFVNGEILRKPISVIRSMMVPVFNIDFEPHERWTGRFRATDSKNDDSNIHPLPRVNGQAKSRSLRDNEYVNGRLILDSDERLQITYENRLLESNRDEALVDSLAYNAGSGVGKTETVHDFFVTCQLIWYSGQVSFRLTDGQDAAELTIDGLTVTIDRGSGFDSIKAPLPITSGQVQQLEFAFVDRAIHVAINGLDLQATAEFPADPTVHGRRTGVISPLQFAVTHGRAEINMLKIFRDVHYRRDGINGIDTPYQLSDDHYFVLGDNSANSRDSRVWKIPSVPGRDFIGKPIFIHQAMRANHVTLNGQDRSYPVLDWRRLRLVR